MLLGPVAHVVIPSIFGVSHGEFGHEPIPAHLRNDRSARHRVHEGISAHNGRPSRSRDRFDVEGRLPLSLLECFDPYYEAFTINFAGLELIVAGPFVRKDDKWALRDSRRRQGIRKIDLFDDGLFRIQATGLDLHGVNFDGVPVDFSLLFDPDDIGEASIQFDRRLHFRAHDGDDDDDDDDRNKRRRRRGR